LIRSDLISSDLIWKTKRLVEKAEAGAGAMLNTSHAKSQHETIDHSSNPIPLSPIHIEDLDAAANGL
jgi:hypothetical protein